jgi:hypothetical protein
MTVSAIMATVRAHMGLTMMIAIHSFAQQAVGIINAFARAIAASMKAFQSSPLRRIVRRQPWKLA